ncbi:MAG: hypothetical protein AAF739_03145 [Pseudomonadota bacterium]
MRSISANHRVSHDAQATDEIEIVLVRITHDDLDEPVRLSTDPTQRLSDDPLAYGTYSSWLTTDDSPFLFVLVTALVPDDLEEAPASASLVFEAVDNNITKLLRSTTDEARVDLAVVLASSPDRVEQEWLDLRLVSSEGDANAVTLQIARVALSSEPFPAGRTTRSRFPGLRRQ